MHRLCNVYLSLRFPSDRNAWDADGQFLLGNGFLITPVLEEGATRVTGYFPGAARWYDYRTVSING